MQAPIQIRRNETVSSVAHHRAATLGQIGLERKTGLERAVWP
jgi:hypothetical protein